MVTKRGALASLVALMAMSVYALTITPVEPGGLGAMINEVGSRLLYGVVIPIVVTISAAINFG